MAADYRRQFTGGEDGISRDGKYASAVWLVTGVASGEEAISNADVPVRYNDPHPDVPGGAARCDNIRVSTISPSCYRLVASFRTPDNGGGTHTDPVTNPLAEPARFRWQPVTMSLPNERDGAGNPILLSSGRGTDPPQPRVFTAYELTVTRNEPNYNNATARLYANTVNSDAWGGAIAGEVRCLDILPTTDYTAVSSYINIAYRFLFMAIADFGPDPHQLRLLDQDTMAQATYEGGGTTFERLVGKSGQPTDGPVLMNGQGAPIDSSITYLGIFGRPTSSPNWTGTTPTGATIETTSTGAVFLRYKHYLERSFSPLGLPV